MTEPKLKPCPWCGGEVVMPRNIGAAFHWVDCVECLADGPKTATRAEAIAAWNRRTPAVSREELEKRITEEIKRWQEEWPSPVPVDENMTAVQALEDLRHLLLPEAQP
jgi:Lar family restriction alleviation protein